MLRVEVVKCRFVSIRDVRSLTLDRAAEGEKASLIYLSIDPLCQVRSDGLNGWVMRDRHYEDVTTPRYARRVRIIPYSLGGMDLSFW